MQGVQCKRPLHWSEMRRQTNGIHIYIWFAWLHWMGVQYGCAWRCDTAAHVIQTFNDTLEVFWRCWTYYRCCTRSCKLVDDEEKPWGWRFTSIFACQCFRLRLWCSLYHLVMRYLRKVLLNGKTHSWCCLHWFTACKICLYSCSTVSSQLQHSEA